ncbi:MAG TPA: hypothetical protein VKM54_25385, partial [Myxococcota bacterium]|nr:hypothetical protein [Myxococcota bacterium]
QRAVLSPGHLCVVHYRAQFANHDGHVEVAADLNAAWRALHNLLIGRRLATLRAEVREDRGCGRCEKEDTADHRCLYVPALIPPLRHQVFLRLRMIFGKPLCREDLTASVKRRARRLPQIKAELTEQDANG